MSLTVIALHISQAEERHLQQQQAEERAQREWEEQLAASRVAPAAQAAAPRVVPVPTPVRVAAPVAPVPPVIANPPPPVAPQPAYVPPPAPQTHKLVSPQPAHPAPPHEVRSQVAVAKEAPPAPEGPTPEEWAAQHPGTLTLTVKCPTDTSVAAWGLEGQQLLVVMPSIMSTVKDVKAQLSGLLGGMPVNKQVLKSGGAFLKDANPLSNYHLATGAVLELVAKKRGGK